MSVILRHAPSGFCYGGQKCWVNGSGHALDLGTIERAGEAAREEDFGGMEIVVSFDDPVCELVLPLSPTGTRGSKTVPIRLQVVVGLPPPNLFGAIPRLPPPLSAGWLS
jgi:hypothetical protein